jgi:hypothetical protein
MQEQSDHEVFSIAFDTSEAERQAAELSEALRHGFPDGIPHELIENVPRLLSDFILADSCTTLGAGGIGERLITLRLGNGFEHVMAALRAGKILDLLHAANLSPCGSGMTSI